MQIDRSKLLRLVKIAARAVSRSKSQAEQLSLLWFDGEYLSAFNEKNGVRLAFKSDFTGGVEAKRLTALLPLMADRQIYVRKAHRRDRLLLWAASGRYALPLRPVEELPWKPQVPEGDGYVLTQQFLTAISLTMRVRPERFTISQAGDTVSIYSTGVYRPILSWVKLNTSRDGVLRGNSQVILPSDFCELITKHASVGSIIKFDNNGAFCHGSLKTFNDTSTEFLFYGTLIKCEEEIDLEEFMKERLKHHKPFTIPYQLKSALEMFSAMAKDETSVISHEINIDVTSDENGNRWLRLFAVYTDAFDRNDSEAVKGSVATDIKLEDAGDQPNISIRVDDVYLLNDVIRKHKHNCMSIGPETIILSELSGSRCMIACCSPSPPLPRRIKSELRVTRPAPPRRYLDDDDEEEDNELPLRQRRAPRVDEDDE